MPQILGREVGPTGFGLMGFTWRSNPPPQSQAFEALRTALSKGMNFWNGGEFYGTPEYNSLTLLQSYFTQYPEDVDKVVLSIKGCYAHSGVDASAAAVRKSMDNILSTLTLKKVDVFECGRRDPNVPLSETFSALQEYIDRGQLGGISLSEVRAETIHEAVKALGGDPSRIAFVENELSLFVTDPLENGVIAACAQYNIPLVAYSPIGHGILGGTIKTAADIPEHLQMMPRYFPEHFEHNLQLFNLVNDLAKAKGCTPAQLAISWVRSLSQRREGLPVIIPIPGTTTAARVEENAKQIDLSDKEMDEIDEILKKFQPKGERYPDWIPKDT
ncbi:pyridoxal reductase [Cladorrhinum sp. PSN259]|nr:pyridoxal reductase [Cladorrhinum sp. PSN259]